MKKKHFFCLLFTALTTIGLVIKANAVEDLVRLTVEIKGIKNKTGQICLGIYDNDRGFPLGNSSEVKSKCTQKIGNSLKLQFTGLKKGTYAVAVVDDQNLNTTLDRDFLGIPEEGFGISNNPSVSVITGAPKFEDASFSLTQNQTIEIEMKYSLDS